MIRAYELIEKNHLEMEVPFLFAATLTLSVFPDFSITIFPFFQITILLSLKYLYDYYLRENVERVALRHQIVMARLEMI